MPVGLSGHAAAHFRDAVYVVGGELAAAVATESVFRNNLDGGAWEQLQDLPRENRFAAGLVVVGDTLYLVGGLFEPGNAPPQARATLFAYLPDEDRWDQRAPLPEARWAAGVAALAGRLYVAGGGGGDLQPTTTLFVYDQATDSWSDAAEMPRARVRARAVTLDGLMYVVGDTDNTRLVDVYDPVADTWSEAPRHAVGRAQPAAVAFEGRLHLLGGNNSRAHEALDTADGTWARLADLPEALIGANAVPVAGHIWFIGGRDGAVWNASVQVFSP